MRCSLMVLEGLCTRPRTGSRPGQTHSTSVKRLSHWMFGVRYESQDERCQAVRVTSGADCSAPSLTTDNGQLSLVQHMNVLLLAHVLQHLRPHGDADLAEVGLAQEQHQRPRLPDAAADAQRDLVIDDRLVVREVEEVELVRQLKLLLQRLR